MTFLLSACTAERRPTGPEQPQTPPNGSGDPRIAMFESNAYQLAQGGRYFAWYGCGGCHSDGAKGALDLSDGQWRRGGAFNQVYAAVADGHGGGGAGRIPIEQNWQIAAYVRSLKDIPPAKRRRQDLDQQAEPQGANWSGPLQ